MEKQAKKENSVVNAGSRPAGTILRTEESSFNLKNLLDPGFRINQHECDMVYFRTGSGNIYMIDKPGSTLRGKPILNVINLKQSVEKGELEYYILVPDAAAEAKLEIGKPFKFGETTTSRVTEIVACSVELEESVQITAEFHRALRDRGIRTYDRTTFHV